MTSFLTYVRRHVHNNNNKHIVTYLFWKILVYSASVTEVLNATMFPFINYVTVVERNVATMMQLLLAAGSEYLAAVPDSPDSVVKNKKQQK